MEHKIPKSLYICGKKYTVQLYKIAGGCYNINERLITIGTLYPNDMFENLVHEVTEVIFHERGHKYTRFIDDDTDASLFTCNHDEFENITNDLTAVIQQLKCI
jgi:hypothetical protein